MNKAYKFRIYPSAEQKSVTLAKYKQEFERSGVDLPEMWLKA